MSRDQIAIIVLAAGMGTRMKSDLPKVLHRVAGRPMLDIVLDEAAKLKPARTIVVVGPDTPGVAERAQAHTLKPRIAVQTQRLGTAHAVRAAEKALGTFRGTILVVYGDSPLMRADTLKRVTRALKRKSAPALSWFSFAPDDVAGYGQFVLGERGAPERIVEAKDLTPETNPSGLCWGGVMAGDGRHFFKLLAKVGRTNKQKEYYLTALIEIAANQGLASVLVDGAVEEALGVNSRFDLAIVEQEMQHRLRMEALAGGVTMIDPTNVYLSMDTKLGRDVTLEPNIFFGPGVKVGDRVTIKANSHIEGATIAPGCIVGPFARLRPGAQLAADVHVGNFVEVKNAVLEAGVKANHLSYLGDAHIGARTNVGAGTITCNYDGYDKHKTEIGADVFIGSDVALVAPVKIGDGAIIGAGSVVTRNVSAESLAVTRAEQKEIKGWAKKRRASKSAKGKKR